jgi:hypothetical protein
MRPAPLPGGKTVKIPAKYLKTTCKAAFSGIKKRLQANKHMRKLLLI